MNYKRLAGEAYEYDSSDEVIIPQPNSSQTTNLTNLASTNKSPSDNNNNNNNTNINNNDSSSTVISIKPGLYANKHIPQIIHRTYDNDVPNPSPDADVLQRITNGTTLSLANIVDDTHPLTLHKPILVSDTPESIGMKIPRGKKKKEPTITIRELGEYIGMNHPVSVMDVRLQDEIEGWDFRDLVEYFEDDDRKYLSNSKKPRGDQGMVLNQISLEFSKLSLRDVTNSPQFVRDIDWIDNVWPLSKKGSTDYPRVQYYCLTSTAGCFTDFHVDFGGTSVWYHVLSGKKVFLLIPPTDDNLALYEMWLCRKDQNHIFFPDMVDETSPERKVVTPCMRITLEQGMTFVIPTGWIHAVYTPVDSLVFGGNFLHGLDIEGQLKVHCIETRTKVAAKFRFPHFVRLMFYAGAEYYKRMVTSHSAVYEDEVNGLTALIEALKVWAVQPGGDADRVGSISHTIQECVLLLEKYHISDVESMLAAMEVELQRIKKIGVMKPAVGAPPKIKLKLNNSSKLNREDSNQEKLSSNAGNINSPKRRPLKLKIDQSNSLSDDDDMSTSPKLVISLKSDKAKKVLDITSKHAVQDDDEWTPRGVGGSKGTKARRKKILPEKAISASTKIPSNLKQKGRGSSIPKRGAKKLGTARSRLKKRLKF